MVLSAGGSSMMITSLKNSQIRAIHRMLAFNDETVSSYHYHGGGGMTGVGTTTESNLTGEYNLPPAGSSHNQWKILIYDKACRSIISPILSVQQLRRRGVTLHLLIDAEREAIPDVPAVYFIRPTKENLAIIAKDCSVGLYSCAYVNFVTKLDRHLMEEFAKLIVQTNSISTISSIHDQYLDFVCYERGLFTLNRSNSYVTYNGSKTTEEQIERAMTEIAYGLFSVVATLGQIPVIRCPRNGAPEMVARKLNRMITEHPTLLRNSKTSTSSGRPLLVILDRNADLITPIQHTSTYQALIDDLLKHNANRVEFTTVQDPNAARPKTIVKKYDLDPDDDVFYSTQRFQPFPDAIECNGTELQEVTRREQEIKAKAASGGGGNLTMSDGAGNTTDLATAVDSLPALLDRKRQLEVHTSILQAVMNEVATRDVPRFFELESSLATGTYKNDGAKAKRDVLALVCDMDKKNVGDKIRLIMVYTIATGAKSTDIDEVTAELQRIIEEQAGGGGSGSPEDGTPVSASERKSMLDELGAGLRAIDYLKQLRSMRMIPAGTDMLQEKTSSSSPSSGNGPGEAPSSGGVGGGVTMFGNLMAKATTQATGLLAKAASSMLGKMNKHHATVVVENICDMRPGTEDETYLYLDPRARGDGVVDVKKLQSTSSTTRAIVRHAICFVVGGGCYGEYQNLQLISGNDSSSGGISSSSNNDHRRTITYGSTEVLDSKSFLSQLSQLGMDA